MIYRGEKYCCIRDRLKTFFDYSGSQNAADFGVGLHAITDIDQAIQYSLESGMIYIFDWTDRGGSEIIDNTKHMSGEFWEKNFC